MKPRHILIADLLFLPTLQKASFCVGMNAECRHVSLFHSCVNVYILQTFFVYVRTSSVCKHIYIYMYISAQSHCSCGYTDMLRIYLSVNLLGLFLYGESWSTKRSNSDLGALRAETDREEGNSIRLRSWRWIEFVLTYYGRLGQCMALPG